MTTLLLRRLLLLSLLTSTTTVYTLQKELLLTPLPKVIHDSCQPYETGVASWYGPRFHGKRTASGSIFNQYHLSAAHRSLHLGTRVRVRSVDSGRLVLLRITDRGPYVRGRSIDLSRKAARELRMTRKGLERVEISVCQ